MGRKFFWPVVDLLNHKLLKITRSIFSLQPTTEHQGTLTEYKMVFQKERVPVSWCLLGCWKHSFNLPQEWSHPSSGQAAPSRIVVNTVNPIPRNPTSRMTKTMTSRAQIGMKWGKLWCWMRSYSCSSNSESVVYNLQLSSANVGFPSQQPRQTKGEAQRHLLSVHWELWRNCYYVRKEFLPVGLWLHFVN